MIKTEDDFIKRIVISANQVLSIMNNQLGDKEGVFVSIYDPSKSIHTSVLTFLVGNVLHSKSQKYHYYSLEKPKRAYEKGHTTSFKSRDENLDQWGGGFYLKEKGFGIGVSGLTENQDMVFAILTAALSKCIAPQEALDIAKLPPGNEVSEMLSLALKNQ